MLKWHESSQDAKGIYYIFIFIYLLAQHFLYIFQYPPALNTLFSGRRLFIIIGAIAVVLSLFCIQRYDKYLFFRKNRITLFLVVYLFCLSIECFYSWWAYNQDFFSIISQCARLLSICLFVPVIVILARDGGERHLFSSLNILSLAWNTLSVIQSIVYSKNGSIVLDFSTYFYNASGVEIRLLNNSIRIGMGAVGNIMLIYNFFCLYTKQLKDYKEKTISLLSVIIAFYSLLFVQQTRMYTIIVFTCLSSIVLFQKENKKYSWIKIGFLFFLIYFIFNSPYIEKLIASFSVTGENRWSTQARLYSVEHYLSCIKRSPIFGNGFLSEIDYGYIVHGDTGQAQYSDVGLLGLCAETGIFSLVFYIWPIVKIISSYVKLKTAKKETSFEQAIILFLILTSTTLIMTDQARIIAFSIILGYFEFKSMSVVNEDIERSTI